MRTTIRLDDRIAVYSGPEAWPEADNAWRQIQRCAEVPLCHGRVHECIGAEAGQACEFWIDQDRHFSLAEQVDCAVHRLCLHAARFLHVALSVIDSFRERHCSPHRDRLGDFQNEDLESGSPKT
jgi:hypothetical protein